MTGPATHDVARRRRWPWLVDISALLLEIPTIVDLANPGDHHHGGGHPASLMTWIIAQALILPLLARRRFPVAVFGGLLVIALGQCIWSELSVADFALLVALYTIAAHRDRRQAIIAAGLLEVGAIFASFYSNPVGDDTLAAIVFLTGLVAAAYFIGVTQRTRREFMASLVDRAERLERERDQQAELAATAERTRIAREMHDIVAHSLSVVITLADGAVAATEADPAAATTAMRQVGETGRQALAEMRRLLGVLRDPRPAELAPQPDLQRLDALIEDVRRAGLAVDFVVTGSPRDLPSTAQATVYRIVQESLTNVLKHAVRPSLARVTLAWSPDELTVEIFDDGAPVRATVPSMAPTGGQGLQGIGERVALYDGSLVTGPNSPRGWIVRARLSLETESM